MPICSNLRARFNEAMAETPPNLYNAAQAWDLMGAANCADRGPDPDPTNQSGGHGVSQPIDP